jgi:CRISPR-associated exonuclease Cas4
MNFYASWVFRCPRWVYFKLTFPEKERINPSIKYAGRIGEVKALRFLRKRYRIYPARKRTISLQKFRISGKPDFRVLGDNGFEIVEVKNVARMGKFPKRRWVAQLNLYLGMERIDRGFILEISGKRIRKSGWRFNRNLLNESIKFYSDIYEKVERREIPEGRIGECLSCSFKDLCLTLSF